ncbi:peptide/nickel transport system permease protein [Aquamicrobium lusatiense]|uniref:Peptide/nickel transport system permease protein n=1 Tax=Aquamicrobium lusatiense TaxID=89772 RepID=A0A7W9VXC7_9HYPH|nr:peptide/nickel transport system permease protein [Aquamicrobium lusatiense]
MIGFILKRLLQAAFVVVAVSLVVAVAIRMTGDPALMISQGATNITEADLQRIREGLGLNEPFVVQYANSLIGLLTWNFGNSFVGGTPVNILISRALPATLMLAFTSLLLSIIISVPLGIRAAVSRGKWSDQLIRICSLVGLSFPNFWLATMLVLLFAVTFRLLPPSGMSGLESFIMPTLTMGIILTATNVRLVRTTMLETLNSQYIMVARAKGLSENKVLYKHALRNCAIPLITYFGLQFGGHRARFQLAGHGHSGFRCRGRA